AHDARRVVRALRRGTVDEGRIAVVALRTGISVARLLMAEAEGMSELVNGCVARAREVQRWVQQHAAARAGANAIEVGAAKLVVRDDALPGRAARQRVDEEYVESLLWWIGGVTGAPAREVDAGVALPALRHGILHVLPESGVGSRRILEA